MTTVQYKVCVVTVTYGQRWLVLKQVIDRVLLSKSVTKVLIVDNNSSYTIADLIKDDRISIITNTENLGSAGGYKIGIDLAQKQSDCDFIWLLDDDNLPEIDVLEKLVKNYQTLPGTANNKALYCLREDRVQHVKIAQGENPFRYYLVPNNFLGFNIFRIVHNQFYKLRDKLRKPFKFKPYVKMPYVPYGGLLFHKDLIKEIGLPDDRFFLYVDDSEFSYRITQKGGNIWLIPECRIIDIDKSQGIGYKGKLFHSQLLDEWNFRIYYHIRNRMYFYSRVAIRNNIVFQINKILYLTFLQVISILSGKTDAYKKLKVAVNDGLMGNLGKANSEKF
ncbi:MAG: glycosyl transferase family 2 [Sphingobacteriales bacterium]|nr:glycosyl transferase family 2 [Sphingobacteriales bacterium]